MPARVQEKIIWLQGAIHSREMWLDDHGGNVKWPASDVESKREGLAIMRDILRDYELSVERAREREAKE